MFRCVIDTEAACTTATTAAASVFAPELYSLGPKPALIRQPAGEAGASIELEVWELPIEKVG